MQQTNFDVAIIGGGPAGLTSAIYTSRGMLKTLLLAGDPPGGQLTTTTEVENFPAFPDGISGPELISKIRSQAEKFGTVIIDANVLKITGSKDEGFSVVLESGGTYVAKAVIIATGASAKWLGLSSEQKLRGKGVSACATCDGFFFKNKVVAVVGAGDVAMEDAAFLTKFATKVYVLVRRSKEAMRASKIMQERALNNPKIEFFYNSEVTEVLGDDHVDGIKVLNKDTGVERLMKDVQGLFIAIGHAPNTNFLQGFVELDSVGYIKIIEGTKTSVEGVFAAGDVHDFRYRQGITAAGEGCKAAIEAQKFIAEL